MHYLAYFHKVSWGKYVIMSVKHCKETFLRVIHRKEVVIKKKKLSKHSSRCRYIVTFYRKSKQSI